MAKRKKAGKARPKKKPAKKKRSKPARRKAAKRAPRKATAKKKRSKPKPAKKKAAKKKKATKPAVAKKAKATKKKAGKKKKPTGSSARRAKKASRSTKTTATPAPSKPAAKPSARALGKTVEDYVRELGGGWQREVVETLRRVILTVAPRAGESIKWGQPVYEDTGPFAYIKAFKTHVNFGFWRGAELPDPLRMLEGTGGKMRHVKIRRPADVVRSALSNLVQAAVRLNREKGDPTGAK